MVGTPRVLSCTQRSVAIRALQKSTETRIFPPLAASLAGRVKVRRAALRPQREERISPIRIASDAAIPSPPQAGAVREPADGPARLDTVHAGFGAATGSGSSVTSPFASDPGSTTPASALIGWSPGLKPDCSRISSISGFSACTCTSSQCRGRGVGPVQGAARGPRLHAPQQKSYTRKSCTGGARLQ